MPSELGLIPMKQSPDATWLVRVRRGNWVYLYKEKDFAQIDWEYDPPGPGNFCGRVGLAFKGGRKDSWYVHADGTGINGTQCLLPVLGNLPDDPPPLPPGELREVLRRLDRLEHAVYRSAMKPPTIMVIEMPTERS